MTLTTDTDVRKMSTGMPGHLRPVADEDQDGDHGIGPFETDSNECMDLFLPYDRMPSS
jgi:hypothetical protein